MQTIYFDMDGTIADLYSVPNWLEKLHNEDVSPYQDARPLVDPDIFNTLISDLLEAGYLLGVISWAAMGGSSEYARATRKAKKEWLLKFCPELLNEFHVVKYDTPKHKIAKNKDSILVDDNEQVRQAWNNGMTIDASDADELIKQLLALLD